MTISGTLEHWVIFVTISGTLEQWVSFVTISGSLEQWVSFVTISGTLEQWVSFVSISGTFTVGEFCCCFGHFRTVGEFFFYYFGHFRTVGVFGDVVPQVNDEKFIKLVNQRIDHSIQLCKLLVGYDGCRCQDPFCCESRAVSGLALGLKWVRIIFRLQTSPTSVKYSAFLYKFILSVHSTSFDTQSASTYLSE